jgi:hypothetical protein
MKKMDKNKSNLMDLHSTNIIQNMDTSHITHKEEEKPSRFK